MSQKIKFALIILTFVTAGFSTLHAEEQVAPDKTAEESDTKKLETLSPKKDAVSENSTAKEISTDKGTPVVKETPVTKKEAKINQGRILKNQALSDEFKESYMDENPMGNSIVNLFYGLVSGGIMGLGGGLSFYTTSTNMTPIFISAGALGAAGAITGIIITIIEKSSNNPLLGNALFEYSWYGTLGGAAIGGLIGLIPYSSTKNIANLLNWVGYGTFAGLAGGIALFIVLPKSTLKHLIIDTDPANPKLGYKFMF